MTARFRRLSEWCDDVISSVFPVLLFALLCVWVAVIALYGVRLLLSGSCP